MNRPLPVGLSPHPFPIATRRRNTELGLVLMAAVITAAAYVLAALGKDTILPPRLIPFLVATVGMLITTHLVNRSLARGADATILPIASLLNGVGYVMIARLSDHLAALQTTWTFIGIAGYVLTLLFVQRAPDLGRFKWTAMALGVGMLLMPLVPGLGTSVGGARIWVRVGPLGFQPGEFAKILLAVFFAGYLAERRELIAASTWRIGPLRLPEPRYLLPIALAWGFSVVVMVAEKDLGSSLMFFTLFVVMLWVATERAAYLVLGLASFAGAAYVSWLLFDHVKLRVNLWLNPWPLFGPETGGKGFQPIQGMFAMADGGLVGRGLGLGSPNKIPAVKTDFIFAAVGEELGLIGATAVLIAFILLVGAGLRIAIRADRPFEKILATGLTTILGIQAFIIVGGVVRLVPLTGVTLPFVSYGGSSLVANYVLLALLVRISDSSARRLGETADALTIGERWKTATLRRAVKRTAKRDQRRAGGR